MVGGAEPAELAADREGCASCLGQRDTAGNARRQAVADPQIGLAKRALRIVAQEPVVSVEADIG